MVEEGNETAGLFEQCRFAIIRSSDLSDEIGKQVGENHTS